MNIFKKAVFMRVVCCHVALWLLLPIVALIPELRPMIGGLFDARSFGDGLFISCSVCISLWIARTTAVTIRETAGARFGEPWGRTSKGLRGLIISLWTLSIFSIPFACLLQAIQDDGWSIRFLLTALGLVLGLVVATLSALGLMQLCKRFSSGVESEVNRFPSVKDAWKEPIQLAGSVEGSETPTPDNLWSGFREDRGSSKLRIQHWFLACLLILILSLSICAWAIAKFADYQFPALLFLIFTITISFQVLASAAYFLDRYRLPLLPIVALVVGFFALPWGFHNGSTFESSVYVAKKGGSSAKSVRVIFG